MKTFKKGDKVKVIETGEDFVFIEYESAYTAKLKNAGGATSSYDLDSFELVAPQSKTPLTDKVCAEIGANIIEHAKAMEIDAQQYRQAAETHLTELDAAKGIAEALEGDLANARKLAESYRIERELLIRERNNWQATAAQHSHNGQYYRGLLEECGKAIGKEAYTCDDGTVQLHVLVVKVPELVKRLVDESRKWSAKEIVEESIQEDFAQQAKDILQSAFKLGGNIRSQQLDNFVDLIIKAAKQ